MSGKSRNDPFRGYAAVVVWWASKTSAKLMSDTKNRVVVFDNKVMAQQFLPLLGDGRICSWSNDGETIFFNPIDPKGINRASIIVPYDVYNLPPNHPVLSEAKNKNWKHHIHYGEWYDDLSNNNERLRKEINEELSRF